MSNRFDPLNILAFAFLLGVGRQLKTLKRLLCQWEQLTTCFTRSPLLSAKLHHFSRTRIDECKMRANLRFSAYLELVERAGAELRSEVAGADIEQDLVGSLSLIRSMNTCTRTHQWLNSSKGTKARSQQLIEGRQAYRENWICNIHGL